MAETSHYLIDLPEFGSVSDWKQALAELSTEPMTPQISEAVNRCREAIAELEGGKTASMGDRWEDHSFTIIEEPD